LALYHFAYKAGKWSWDELLDLPVVWLSEWADYEAELLSGSVPQAGQQIPEAYRTRQWEERIGPNEVKRHYRVNIDDMLDNPMYRAKFGMGRKR
jgi:hypothetical protein